MEGVAAVRMVTHNGSVVFLNAPALYKDLRFINCEEQMSVNSLGFIFTFLESLPVIEYQTIESGVFRLRLLQQYRVLVNPEGILEVRIASSVLEPS